MAETHGSGQGIWTRGQLRSRQLAESSDSVTALIEWCVCVISITQDLYISFIKINKENKEIAIGQQFTWPYRLTNVGHTIYLASPLYFNVSHTIYK